MHLFIAFACYLNMNLLNLSYQKVFKGAPLILKNCWNFSPSQFYFHSFYHGTKFKLSCLHFKSLVDWWLAYICLPNFMQLPALIVICKYLLKHFIVCIYLFSTFVMWYIPCPMWSLSQPKINFNISEVLDMKLSLSSISSLR